MRFIEIDSFFFSMFCGTVGNRHHAHCPNPMPEASNRLFTGISRSLGKFECRAADAGGLGRAYRTGQTVAVDVLHAPRFRSTASAGR